MDTSRPKHELNFILILVLFTLYISYLIYAPFIYDFIIAAGSAAILKPFYNWLMRKTNRPNLSAAICVLTFIIIVIGPTTLLVTALTRESFATYNLIREQIQSGALTSLFDPERYPWLRDGYNYISQYVDLSTIDIKSYLADQVKAVSLWVYEGGRDILASVSLIFFNFFFVLLMFYFLIRDSKAIMKEIGKFSPISSSNEAVLTEKFTDVSQAIFKGSFLTALVQGAVLGIGFVLLDLPSPLFWSFVTSFFALIPLIGTAFVWFPAVIILLVSGAYLKSVLLLLWGALLVSTIDNLIRPYLMRGKTNLPAIVIFFAVLGGVGTFGAMGIIIAPMITVFLLTLLEMYGQAVSNGNNHTS
ncbi:MAG: hypothetical protein A2V81_00390 [Candidatus Abawacabacteria bacterium RBG_16_42_10]|uniref:AI-2E family transporter n=1 Tax=Candidatus Abawacabacteria bacterium RBG_16_42_10 TaxID=1817814 RepID=A0A1F4XJ94_9BACT|nr:MAG: hypothetical protein A2V81_00390 [Candidatus Abawacabacteria bacterium RBG_16_42_10]